jgi:hypothetical protein
MARDVNRTSASESQLKTWNIIFTLTRSIPEITGSYSAAAGAQITPTLKISGTCCSTANRPEPGRYSNPDLDKAP